MKHPVSFAAALAMVVMMAVIVMSRGDHVSFGWMDNLLFLLFIPLLAWLISSRDRSAHDEPGESFALRLGQACKRTLRRLKGRGVSA
jgi:hypothetical protein